MLVRVSQPIMANETATSSDYACEHCGIQVQSEVDHAICMGFCEQVAHIKCIKLKEPYMKCIQERSCLFWMCKQCSHLMSLIRFKKVMSQVGAAISSITDSHNEKISELKQAIADNGEKIDVLSSKFTAATSTTELKQAISDNGKKIEVLSSKFTAVAPSTELKQAISDHGKKIEVLSRKFTASTPLSSRPAVGQPPQKRPREEHLKDPKPLIGGTKASYANTVLTVPPPREQFWLYLSRIHTSVKGEAMETLAKECLQCDDPIHVISLVKKNADMSSLNFISFKVGMDVKYRDVALNPATWPQGILFREFEGASTKNYWAPPGINASKLTPRVQLTPAPGPSPSSNFLSPASDTGATSMDSS